jgi:O-antigen ligase
MLRVPYVCLTTYIGAVFLSEFPLIAHPDFPLLLSKCLRLLGILAPALLFGVISISDSYWRRIIRTFYWSGLISVLYGIIAFYFQWPFGTAVQRYYYDPDSYLRRAGGVFQDSSAFGHLLATWAAVAILFHARNSANRTVHVIITTAVTAVGLYACLSRAAIANLLAVVALMCALPATDGRAVGKRHLAGAAVCGLLLLAVVSRDVRERFTNQAEFTSSRIVKTWTAVLEGVEALDDSAANRLTTWRRAIEIWEDHPLLGTGYKSLVQFYGIYSDNTLILAMTETGLLGALLFCIGVISLFVKAVGLYFRHVAGSREIVIFLIGQAVHSFLVDTVTFTGSMPLVFIVAMATCRRELFRRQDFSAVRLWSAREVRLGYSQ